MRICLLTVPDCPNAPLARRRIIEALGSRDADIEMVAVSTLGQAREYGMTGSPTVLVDGIDPFAEPGAEPNVSCRLYRAAGGAVEGAPSVDALRRVLDAAGPACWPPDATAVGVDRGGRVRLAPVTGGLRAVQRAILRHFAATGRAPDRTVLAPVARAAGRHLDEALAELVGADFLTLDPQNRIHAAYPFSAVPTRHRVTLADGVEVWAMCAIDALGIPSMLGTDAVIHSIDPGNGAPITVTVASGHTHVRPKHTVVLLAQRAVSGPAESTCCDVLNFFTDRSAARTWARRHTGVTGRPISVDQARRLGEQTFGPLLGADE